MRHARLTKVLRSFCVTHLNFSHFQTAVPPIRHHLIPNSTVNRSQNSELPLFFSSVTSSEDNLHAALHAATIRPKDDTFDGDESNDDEECDGDSENDDVQTDVGIQQSSCENERIFRDVQTIVEILLGPWSSRAEMKNRLEQCGVESMSSDLVVAVLSRVRNDWESAFTFFLWAGKQPDYAHSNREYHTMISILGKMRKFDTAWALIDEMRGGRTGPSLVTFQTLLILIRKYCAVHDVGRAINTFYAYKRFKFGVGVEEFQGLLSALCRYKNVQDAEQLLYCNRNVFPFNVKSFNIILNGWCNIIVSSREAERFWGEMSRRGIRHDVVSYGCIISCYSRSRNLYKVLRLFDRMKEMKIEPDRKVYNAVIHALAKGKFVKDAFGLLKTMEEKGIAPNVVTYNSLIKPLCKTRNVEEARQVFNEMLQRGWSPTIQTYHAFLRNLTTKEEVFQLMRKMRKMGCNPTNDTYIMLIRKFCRRKQLDSVSELWDEMIKNGISPDRSSYSVLIHGLFLNGKVEEAYKCYIEMKQKGFLPEPKIDEILQAWKSGKETAESQMVFEEDFHSDRVQLGNNTKKVKQERDFVRQPETRRVVRERGFSFWEK